jgi:predicted NBD/HSP70 family sugar kinase
MAAVIERARRGEARAAGAFREAGLALGYGLARAIALLDLERVTFVGAGLRARDLLEPSIREGLDLGLAPGLRRTIPIDVAPWDQDLMTQGLTATLLGDLDKRLLSENRSSTLEAVT